MKLLFDARHIRTDFHDGISRFSAELAQAVYTIHPDTTYIICNRDQTDLLPAGVATIMLHPPTSWREPLSAFYLNKYHPDVVFSPMQTIGGIGRRFKLILTLHDMIYYRHSTPPRNLNWAIRIGWRLYHLSYWPQRLTLDAATAVATVSNTSKRDIEAAKLTTHAVVVIPNAPQKLADLVENKDTTWATPTNLIYMGSFMPYKNVETLIRGMAFLPTDYTLHLLSRIKPARRAELERIIPKGARVIFHDGVSDAEYANLIAQSALLVTASFDEGYGIPIAEALALGTPVVVSDIDIFHEVAGDGGLYFNPNLPQAFAQQVTIASSQQTYQRLSQSGQQHVVQFSWDTSARTLVNLVESL